MQWGKRCKKFIVLVMGLILAFCSALAGWEFGKDTQDVAVVEAKESNPTGYRGYITITNTEPFETVVQTDDITEVIGTESKRTADSDDQCGEDEQYTVVYDGGIKKTAYDWSQYTCSYFYDNMTSDEQALYDNLTAVCNALADGDDDVTEQSSSDWQEVYYITPAAAYSNMGVDQAMKVALVFATENPQYYFLSAGVQGTSNWLDTGGYVQLMMYDEFADGLNRAAATQVFKQNIESYVALINQETTTLNKERKIHDILMENIEYAEHPFDQSSASVLLFDNGITSVCAGYAEAFEVLANAVGIDAVAVTSQNHEWNKVKIDGTWYGLDVTWDDTGSNHMAFFNVSDATLESAGYHTVESLWDNYAPPAATTTCSSSPDTLQHASYTQVSVVNGSCSRQGCTTYRCAICSGESYTLYRIAFHTWDSKYTIDVASTCQSNGSKSIHCTKCDAKRNVTTLPLASHSYSATIISPTPSSQGYTSHHCTVCGNTYMDTYTNYESIYYNGIDYGLVFDATYYADQYADVRSAYGNDKSQLLMHFVNYGMREGRQGKSIFNVASYKNQYVDLRTCYGNDLVSYYLHYINYGYKEGRAGTGCTSVQGAVTSYDGIDYSNVYSYKYYLENNPDVKNAVGNDDIAAIRHFVTYGMSEGRQAINSFHVGSYRNRYADLRNAYGSDLKNYYLHYIRWGKAEGRVGTGAETTLYGYNTIYQGVDYSAVYDYNYYIGYNADVRQAFGNDENAVLAHFVNYGMSEGRRGNASFNVYTYRQRYGDLQQAFGNNLKSYYLHYVYYGQREGRTAI